MGALAGLDLECLELLELTLACLLDQPLLHVGWQLDRKHAEVALVIDLDRGVARGSGHLLVGGEERVLERGDERAALDPLFALDVANRLDDLLTHFLPFVDQVAPNDRVVRDVNVVAVDSEGDVLLGRVADFAAKVLPAAELG